MGRVRKLFPTIAIACWLGSAAHAEDAPDFKATAHSVAVVSLLGEQIEIMRLGMVMSGGTFWAPATVSNSGFDATAEGVMRERLTARFSDINIEAIGVPRETLMTALYGHNGFGDVGMDNLRAALASRGAEHPIDYIVILREIGGVPFSNAFTKAEFFGIGLYEGTPVAFLNVTVCDGRTLKPVAEISVRDVGWGSIQYTRGMPKDDQLGAFGVDVRKMIRSVVPGLMDGIGL